MAIKLTALGAALLAIAGASGGCGGGKASADCPDAGTVYAGNFCNAGSSCPQDSEGQPGASCSCVGGFWHCSYTVCPTALYSGITFDGTACTYIDAVPAGCACASSYSPQQGHSYCLCRATSADAGGG